MTKTTKLSKETVDFLYQGSLLPENYGILMTREIANELLEALDLNFKIQVSTNAKTETTPVMPNFHAIAEKIGDQTIEFLKDEDELPIHTDDRYAVIADIEEALVDAYSKGYKNGR